MKGVIYARYSSDNQTEASIEGQLRECMEFAERAGIDVIGNYIDRAFSAKSDHRPEFQRMIKDSYKHAFDCIIVWKLDRFSRNRYDSAHYKTLLRKNGVKVVSAMESISEGSEGILLESVLEGMAEYYSNDVRSTPSYEMEIALNTSFVFIIQTYSHYHTLQQYIFRFLGIIATNRSRLTITITSTIFFRRFHLRLSSVKLRCG